MNRQQFVKLAIICVGTGLLSACSEPAKSQMPRNSENSAENAVSYYNLSDDPDSLQLLGLGDIRSEHGKDYIEIVDLFRGALIQGIVSTWEIDCPRERMRIVKNMAFTPDAMDAETEIDGEVVSARSSPASWTIFKLVCDGTGRLIERQVYRQPLDQIAKNFWGLK